MLDSKVWELKHRRIITPVFWVGHIPDGEPRPWEEISEIRVKGEEIKVDAALNVMLSAYKICDNKKLLKDIKEAGNIKNWLSRDRDNINGTAMDSGGFFFQTKESIEARPEKIMDVFRICDPDLCTVLDYPLNPQESIYTNFDRIKTTLKNTEEMLQDKGDLVLLPIIHGYTRKVLEKSWQYIRLIYERYYGLEKIPAIGIGSLVPIIKSVRWRRQYYVDDWGLASFRKVGMSIVHYIRQMAGDETVIHVFGTAGVSMMHLMYMLGVDSVDSAGWRHLGGRGLINIFGLGTRKITRREKDNSSWAKYVEKQELAKNECPCPICSSQPDLLKKSERARMLHNAYVYLQESCYARLLISDGNEKEYVQFLKERFNRTQLSSLFDYVLRIREKRKPVSLPQETTTELLEFFSYDPIDYVLDHFQIEDILNGRRMIKRTLHLILDQYADLFLDFMSRNELKKLSLDFLNWKLIDSLEESEFLKFVERYQLPILFIEVVRRSRLEDKSKLLQAFYEEPFNFWSLARNIGSKEEMKIVTERFENAAKQPSKELIQRAITNVRKEKFAPHLVTLLYNTFVLAYFYDAYQGREHLDILGKIIKMTNEKKMISPSDVEKILSESHFQKLSAEQYLYLAFTIELLRKHRRKHKFYEFPVQRIKKTKLLARSNKEQFEDYILNHKYCIRFINSFIDGVARLS